MHVCTWLGVYRSWGDTRSMLEPVTCNTRDVLYRPAHPVTVSVWRLRLHPHTLTWYNLPQLSCPHLQTSP